MISHFSLIPERLLTLQDTAMIKSSLFKMSIGGDVITYQVLRDSGVIPSHMELIDMDHLNPNDDFSGSIRQLKFRRSLKHTNAVLYRTGFLDRCDNMVCLFQMERHITFPATPVEKLKTPQFRRFIHNFIAPQARDNCCDKCAYSLDFFQMNVCHECYNQVCGDCHLKYKSKCPYCFEEKDNSPHNNPGSKKKSSDDLSQLISSVLSLEEMSYAISSNESYLDDDFFENKLQF
jgi:hypothetical protein